MAYVDFTNEIINNYYNEFKNRYSSRLLEFEPLTIEDFLSHFNREKELKKLLAKKDPLERCEVKGLALPIICSPSFINQLGFQVQTQIEEAIGIKDIHRLTPACINFVPFVSNYYYRDDETFNFNEKVNGISYSYFQYYAGFFIRI